MIEIKNLSHVYKLRGKKTLAIDDVTFNVKKGEIFGLLGTNGAGKTTLTKVLTTLLYPTSGSVKIAGMDIRTQAKEVRKKIGVVFGMKMIYGAMTGRDNLRFFGDIYDVQDVDHKIDELTEFFEMEEKIDTLVEAYSSGMRMKLALMRGLLNDPEILLMDEPTLGLDPNMQFKIRTKIKGLQGQGRTIVLTTHYMQEAEYLCQRIAIMNRGKLVAIDTPKTLRKNLPGKNMLKVEFEHESSIERLRRDYILTGDKLSIIIPIDDSGHLNKVLADLLEKKLSIKNIKLVEPTLDSVFNFYTK